MIKMSIEEIEKITKDINKIVVDEVFNLPYFNNVNYVINKKTLDTF